MMPIGHRNEVGRLMARALRGAWRPEPSPLDMSEAELERITRTLLQGGEAGLVHRRLAGTALESTPAAERLLAGTRHTRLRNRLIEHRMPRVFSILEDADACPLLVKGPSVARHYADRGLRPFGDLDICVRPSAFERARRALAGAEPLGVSVDLHRGITNEQGKSLLEDPAPEVYARSRVEPIAPDTDVRIRMLAPEDSLRLICLHMMRHGAMRPLWLCDVAAMVESLPDDFDLERCLGHDRARSDWVDLSIALAHHLLGASLGRLPAGYAPRLPEWLRTAVLRHWSEFGEPEPRPLRTYLLRPDGFYDKLRWRWVNPLAFTPWWRGPLQSMPRWAWQIREFLTPGSRLFRQVPQVEVCELE